VTYQPPPKEQPPKPRYVRVTDPNELVAIERSGFIDPIGYVEHTESGTIGWATADSLRQYRERIALADGGES